ncbi:P-loop containing nucleoside triphosphate hydrolase protein [Mycena metata]|uniref:P-loop containing nucleoside triphosphate hydrolase protein n=1 Tax=Mycena metata TaxID=1033252 RepID=A0AAD7N205_9AGAR|nr:P-loop containing nucleoside triphosphate hydrolase protein [Mycena metata]
MSSPQQLSQSAYATGRKEMLALISRLRSVGAQTELDLPRIAVIGNQSAGKSSVVEAISGIKVPRESGTCTRCPFECRMSSAPEWSCRISIRREFDPRGKRLGQVSEVAFGGPIQDKDAVELMLRRAQLAALDSSINFGTILEMDVQELKEKSQTAAFSKNVVCIDLEGPDLTDLQFVDLPGIIQNAKADMVRLVEEMVVENIRGNCLILVAIPMTDDIENQKAMSLARDQDPHGNRTIGAPFTGVLTKPDLISAGSTKSRALWLDVIEGRRHKLLHGYYCTRQPDEEERAKGVTVSEARKAERDFFASTPGWSTSTDQDRFGTDKVISTLSTLLVQIIVEKLPAILRTASTHLEQCRAALASLPEPSTEDPATHMLTLITEFCGEIRQIVHGSSNPRGLVQNNNAAFADFKIAIRRTAPRFVALVDADDGSVSADVGSDDEDGSPDAQDKKSSSPRKPIYLSDVREVLRQARARELPGDVPPAAKALLIADFQETWGSSTEACFQRVRQSVMNVLVHVMDRIFFRYGTLRNTLHAYLFDLLALHTADCVKYLEAILEMETTPMTQNDHYLQVTTEKWAARYKEHRAGKPSGAAASKHRKTAKTAPNNAFSFATSSVASPAPLKPVPGFVSFAPPPPVKPIPKPFAPPTSTPATTTPEAPPAFAPPLTGTAPIYTPPAPPLPHPFSPFVAASSPVSGGIPTSSAQASQVDTALALLAQLGYTGLTEDDLGKLRGGDEYETEIMLMSGVRAYFQASTFRVIDNIPGLIDAKFVKALAKGLQANLIREFKLGQPEAHAKCAEYLTEDPAVVNKRGELAQRMRMLEGVQRDLLNFEK